MIGDVDKEQATPPVNIYEGNGQLSIALPVPGAHREHTKVLVRPDRLHISAEGKYAQENQHYHRREWQVGAWELDLELPKRVDPSRAHARVSMGVLVVMAPLSEEGEGEARPKVEGTG
jgi:HSP20 family molecular chaperone IbpA